MSTAYQSLFESLHTQYRSMVRQMCMGFMKGDRDLANDLSQDVFINIWKALDGFRSESSYKTWIYRITVNTCLQQIRRDKNKTKVPVDDVHLTEEEDNKEQQFQQLYAAIGQLTEVDRVLIMMVLDDLEYEEIGKVMGITEGNLRVKIHRIKERLKKILEHEQ